MIYIGLLILLIVVICISKLIISINNKNVSSIKFKETLDILFNNDEFSKIIRKNKEIIAEIIKSYEFGPVILIMDNDEKFYDKTLLIEEKAYEYMYEYDSFLYRDIINVSNISEEQKRNSYKDLNWFNKIISEKDLDEDKVQALLYHLITYVYKEKSKNVEENS